MPISLPMVIAVAALHATPVAADGIPNLNVTRECQAEVTNEAAAKSCIDEENRWRGELQKEWTSFNAEDRRQCGQEAAMGGATSYAEFLTCLEMARDTRKTHEAESEPAKSRK